MLNKIISTAAIFGSAAAFVNAETVLTLTSSELDSSGTTTLTESVNSGYGNVSLTVVLDAEALQALLTSTSLDKIELASITGTSTSIGVGTNYSSSSGVATSKSLFGYTGSTYNFQFGDLSSTNFISMTDYVYAALTLTLSSSGTSCYLTLLNSEGIYTTYSGTASSLKSSSMGGITKVSYNTDYVTYLVLDNTVLDATSAASANVSAIQAVMISSVPEPSLFGIFAGISALALAGTRRKQRSRA